MDVNFMEWIQSSRVRRTAAVSCMALLVLFVTTMWASADRLTRLPRVENPPAQYPRVVRRPAQAPPAQAPPAQAPPVQYSPAPRVAQLPGGPSPSVLINQLQRTLEYAQQRGQAGEQEGGATLRFTDEGTAGSVEGLPSPQQPRRGDAPRVHRVELRQPQIDIAADDGLISLVVRDASLRDVLTMLGESLKLNIIITSEVDATLNISLEGVKLDTLLNSVTSATGHAWAVHDNIIHVTSLNATRGVGANVQGRRVQIFELNYIVAADVADIVTGMLSPVGQSYTIASATDDNRRTREAIVVEDVPAVILRVADVIQEADIPPRQVVIEAHILQVDLSDDNRHGVNLQHFFDLSGYSIDFQTTGLANATAPQAFFGTIAGPDLSGLLEWLQVTSDAKTLASPRITVLNHQSARIQIGEQLGFRVSTTTETSTQESVQFLDVGVLLEVTPQIVHDQHVLLQVRPEISSGEVNPDTGLPQEETTEVETNVLLDDGKGIVIGGLIQERDVVSQSKLPWLGDLRHLGALFGRRVENKSRSEIIIALIPRILPFNGEREMLHMQRLEQSMGPIYQGALERTDRPWEPRQYDPKLNPRHVHVWGRHCGDCSGPATHEPIDSIQSQPPVYTPTPAIQSSSAAMRPSSPLIARRRTPDRPNTVIRLPASGGLAPGQWAPPRNDAGSLAPPQGRPPSGAPPRGYHIRSESGAQRAPLVANRAKQSDTARRLLWE